MIILQAKGGLDWQRLLLGEEEWSFLLETMLRTGVMFIIILVSLRLLGKRGVKQLSVFELVVIIGLGSAAGDPMFYKDVGLLVGFVVFCVVIGSYKLINYLIASNKKFEKVVEGMPVCLIKNGVFKIENFKKEPLTEDEFFAELRLRGVSQLGQIEEAIEESNGNISVFYFSDKEVKPGLSVMPGALDQYVRAIKDPGFYSCIFCGFTDELKPATQHTCPSCKKLKWTKASHRKRIV
ncbi:MAG: DUF421 domain-containing protein [Saprospiraceae bacterium]|nr:DUF421 domain-containing protein [Saprospiraceae bacterium]